MNTTENKVSYKDAVLESNKALREEKVKLGGAIKTLIALKLSLNPVIQIELEKLNKEKEYYKNCAANCRKSPSGNYTPFYVMQFLYKVYKSNL